MMDFFMWFQSSKKVGMHILLLSFNKRFQARLFTHLIDTHDGEWSWSGVKKNLSYFSDLSHEFSKVLEFQEKKPFTSNENNKIWIISIRWYLYAICIDSLNVFVPSELKCKAKKHWKICPHYARCEAIRALFSCSYFTHDLPLWALYFSSVLICTLSGFKFNTKATKACLNNF